MKSVKVTFKDGNSITTEINGSREEITSYYLNNYFNIDPYPKENLQRAEKVEFLTFEMGEKVKLTNVKGQCELNKEIGKIGIIREVEAEGRSYKVNIDGKIYICFPSEIEFVN